jgi:5-methylcytosine-specific restriction endonuclease McrA
MSDRRTEFDEKTRVKRLHFAQFKCEGLVGLDDGETTVRCNAVLTRRRVEFDHFVAAELGGQATFDNCRAVCVLCHRAKYPADAAKIAQAKRREAADLGAQRPSDHPMRKAAKEPRAPLVTAPGQPGIAKRYVNK